MPSEAKQFKKSLSSEFEELTQEDLDSPNRRDHVSISTAVVFDKGIVHHPRNNQIRVHLHGHILLPLQLGEFPKVPLHALSKMPKINADKCSISKLTLFICPTLKPWNKKSDIFVKSVYLVWKMENFFTVSGATTIPHLNKQHFMDFNRFITNIMSGYYRTEEAIPTIDIEFFNSILRDWFEIYLQMKEHVIGFEKYHDHFLVELVNWVKYQKACAVFLGNSWEPHGNPYLAQIHMNGRKVILELLQLLTATYVDSNFRSHILFTMMRDSADMIVNLSHNILSFGKDSTRFQRNPLISAINKGCSLERAVYDHLKLVNKEVEDLRKLGNCIIDVFSNTPPILKYVRNTLIFVEGTIRYFLEEPMGEAVDHSIMKLRRRSSSNISRPATPVI